MLHRDCGMMIGTRVRRYAGKGELFLEPEIDQAA
jgi:hypothetical protein